MKQVLLGLFLASSLLAVPEGGVPVPLRTGNTTLPVGATFLDRYRNLSLRQWIDEFDEMRRNGISHVFIVSAGTLGASPGTIENPIYPSQYATQSGARDLLGLWLQLASERDMFIHVGSLQTRGDWTTGAEFVNLRATNVSMYREIIQRYRSHKSLVGAPFAQELWVNWAWTEKVVSGRDYPGSIIASQFIQDIRQLCRETGKCLVTSSAPVFKKQSQGTMRGLAVGEIGNAVQEILRLAPFDLLMLQDGIGVGTQTGSTPLSELEQYLLNARAGADSTGTEFWVVPEFFEDDLLVAQGNPNRPRHAFRPASIERIAAQIAAATPHVRGMCMWTFGDHMSSMATYEPVAARALSFAYRARYDSRFSNPAPVQVISYQYQYGLKPHSSLPDSTWSPKLTDDRGLGYNAFIGETPDYGWNNLHGPDAGVGFMATTTGSNTKPLFEFLPNTKVGRIEIAYRTGWGAIAPSTLEAVEVSNNGINWTTATVQSRVRPVTDTEFGVTWSVMNINAQGRYVRLTIPFSKAGWYVIGEVRFFGERDPNPATSNLTMSFDKPPANRPWFVPGEKVNVRWNLSGPKVEGLNTFIVLESAMYGSRYIDFSQKYICESACGVFVGTRGAVSHNGENSYEFVVPQVWMGFTFRIGIITMGPESVHHWLSSTETIDVMP